MESIAQMMRGAGLGPKKQQVIFLEAEDDESHDDIRDALRDALKAELPNTSGYYAWVVEVWDTEFIYEHETPTETHIFKRDYSMDDDGAITLGDPVEVERKTEFVPIGESLLEAKTKSEGDKKFPASDYAYVPDSDKPSTWKLRLTSTPGGAPDSGIVGAAAAALGPGFRGQKVKIPADALVAVKTKVRAAWKKANPDKDADEMPAGIKESASAELTCTGQIIQLIETSVRPDGTVPIKVIEPGWGSSAYYPADVLERDGPNVFPKGTHMGWDHMTETEESEKPEGALDDLAAVLESDAHWEPNHPRGPGLYADAKVFGPFDEKLDDMAPHIGTSINTSGVVEADQYGNIIEGEREGRTGPILKELKKDFNTSIDFVTRPGAGGAVLQLFESLRPKKKQGVTPMPEEKVLQETQDKLAEAETKVTELEAKETEREEDMKELASLRDVELVRAAGETVAEALKDLDLHEVTTTRLVKELSEGPPVKDGELDVEALKVKVQEAAAQEAEYLEKLTGAGEIKGMGGGGDGDEGRKALEESVRAMHPDFSDDQVRIYVTGR